MEKITVEELVAIFNDEDRPSDWTGDNAYQGAMILAKYFDPMTENIITGADHDVMFSVDGGELVKRGLTKDDAEALSKLNWCFDAEDGDGDYPGNFYCFV